MELDDDLPDINGDHVPETPPNAQNGSNPPPPSFADQNDRLFDISIDDGRYRLYQTLDSNVASKVYLGFDMYTQEKLVVKYFDTTNEDYEKYLPSFDIYRALLHKSIISVNSIVEGDDYIAFVMPNCREGDLYFKIHEGTKYRIDQAMYIMWDMAQAVFHIHQLGYVHGNISLENILLKDPKDDKESQKDPQKEDIPIALLTGFSHSNENRINIEDIPGFEPDFYTAPEVLTTRTLTPSTDVYALGNVFYLLLMSCQPDSEYDSTFEQHKANLLAGMLNADPAQRLTIQDVIQHPFFQRHLEHIGKSEFDVELSIRIGTINSALKEADQYLDDFP